MTVTEQEETNPTAATAADIRPAGQALGSYPEKGKEESAPAKPQESGAEEGRQAAAADASETAEEGRSHRKRNLILFALVAFVWFAIDAATKAFFDAQYQPNQAVTEPILGIFQFRLVHNTGAAWGMFGDSTFMLGIMSSAVCILLLVYLFYFSPRATIGEVVGLALVFAGGIGNAVNRFTLGYVVDFIEPSFIDFPVFNIADIGVTCGFIIFLVSFLFFSKDGFMQPAAEKAVQDSEGGKDGGEENGDAVG